jgi:hypothetical protein
LISIFPKTRRLSEMPREIEIEWPELGTKVVATLADDKNPSLCNVLYNSLPIETIQTHSGCSGDMMYAFHDIVDFVKPEYIEDYTDKKYWGKVPVQAGLVRFSAYGFQSISIQWSKKRTEPAGIAPVAFVKKEDLGKLYEVGKRVLEGMFTGKYYKVKVKRVE